MPMLISPNSNAVTLTATFLDYDSLTDDEDILNVDGVTGVIYKLNTTTSMYDFNANFTPTKIANGIYQYDWTPTEAAKFKIVFTATLGPVSFENIRFIYVGDIDSSKALVASDTSYYLGVLDPLYIDPEEVLTYFADGDLIEITELVHWFSKEVLQIKNLILINEVTPLMHDFILTSVLCELSRIHTYAGGMTGFTNATQFTLGDLNVMKAQSNQVSKSRNGYDRGNATTWCELAALLRTQLTSNSNTFKSIIPGINHCSPIPERALKRID